MSHYPHWANNFDDIARISRARQQELEDAPVHEAAPVPLQMALTAGEASPPVAMTPDQLLHRRLPNLVWQYLRCWQTVVCRLGEPEKPKGLVTMTRMAPGDGMTERSAHLFTVSPMLTNKIYLVDNGPRHRFNLPNAGPLIWIAKDPANVGTPSHGTADVSAPYPRLDFLFGHDAQTGQRRGVLHKQYAEWANGRYGAAPEYTQRWTIDSDSPHLTEAQRNPLKGPFQRVAWRMMGPFDAHGVEQDPSVLVEHGEIWHPTSTFHLLKVWHASAPLPVHFGIKVLGLHEPGSRAAGESAAVLR
ncbi:hypothetical protein NBRC10512_003080 [Rhodotorula toruloides]|uniref:RHTO0S05e10814g1_1 n=2 Tax=Rhodotorula toruloides TaxID=5286 RepID=A0A061B090_RHOTO|nr:uncharacterized protein RHTO_06732 [Rhodotorula toruloides NP11]EMS23673.1 hypothetical protein RHTO_06732 [Rhodotorula toruloides NP11]CDR41010.1 RHTO0S05e10814g1_1 [Rhodotorula toruloides]